MTTQEDMHAPVLPGRGASDYERYLRTDDLLALQKSPDEQTHHDELLFQTVHQASELWLKLAVTEVEQAASELDAGRSANAARMLRRSTLALQYVTTQLEMLNQMDPWEYQQIRVVLGHGSGFDSPGFRRMPHAIQHLWAAFDRRLGDAGLTLTELYQHRPEYEDLHAVAEGLTDLDEHIWVWRFRHYTIVARALGEETVGTQGTPVQVLGKLIAQRQLPKLWETRSRLVELFDTERAAAGDAVAASPPLRVSPGGETSQAAADPGVRTGGPTDAGPVAPDLGVSPGGEPPGRRPAP
jgi:tryptophan 2,3-dioxygenase